jgi:hypothetical protein
MLQRNTPVFACRLCKSSPGDTTRARLRDLVITRSPASGKNHAVDDCGQQDSEGRFSNFPRCCSVPKGSGSHRTTMDALTVTQLIGPARLPTSEAPSAVLASSCPGRDKRAAQRPSACCLSNKSISRKGPVPSRHRDGTAVTRWLKEPSAFATVVEDSVSAPVTCTGARLTRACNKTDSRSGRGAGPGALPPGAVPPGDVPWRVMSALSATVGRRLPVCLCPRTETDF